MVVERSIGIKKPEEKTVLDLREIIKERKYKDFFQVLKSLKINQPIDEQGNTPLHYAVMHNDYLMTEWLLKKGANPNIPNKHKRRAIDIALKPGSMATFLSPCIDRLLPLLGLYSLAHRSGIKAEDLRKMEHPWRGKKYYRSAPLSDVMLEVM